MAKFNLFVTTKKINDDIKKDEAKQHTEVGTGTKIKRKETKRRRNSADRIVETPTRPKKKDIEAETPGENKSERGGDEEEKKSFTSSSNSGISPNKKKVYMSENDSPDPRRGYDSELNDEFPSSPLKSPDRIKAGILQTKNNTKLVDPHKDKPWRNNAALSFRAISDTKSHDNFTRRNTIGIGAGNHFMENLRKKKKEEEQRLKRLRESKLLYSKTFSEGNMNAQHRLEMIEKKKQDIIEAGKSKIRKEKRREEGYGSEYDTENDEYEKESIADY